MSITASSSILATAWRAHAHTRAGILVDARDYYRAFYETASRARRSILLLGWQFDSDVQLLRGDDVPPDADPESLRLLPFLERLTTERPELEVRVLAWDHSVVFAMERELLQKLWFDLRTGPRFYFELDNTVPEYGAHHQKVAVVDGQIAFLGSADICQDRWDTSAHACDDADRVGRAGKACKPYHEVQAALAGDAARSLVELFVDRWKDATGDTLDARALVASSEWPLALPSVTIPMPDAEVGIYRELPQRLERPPVHEVKALLTSAIASAEGLVYIETQYLTSQAIAEALSARMRDASRPKLDIVVVLPHKPEALKEELAIGGTQATVLAALSAVALETKHAFGVYNVAVRRGSEDVFVYIHSKLMIVDDRVLTVGSANLNNRSMSLDSEINAAWIAKTSPSVLARAIGDLRRRLLTEHIGRAVLPEVLDAAGLVARLDAMVSSRDDDANPATRLRAHDLTIESSPLFEVAQRVASAYADPPLAPEEE